MMDLDSSHFNRLFVSAPCPYCGCPHNSRRFSVESSFAFKSSVSASVLNYYANSVDLEANPQAVDVDFMRVDFDLD